MKRVLEVIWRRPVSLDELWHAQIGHFTIRIWPFYVKFGYENGLNMVSIDMKRDMIYVLEVIWHRSVSFEKQKKIKNLKSETWNVNQLDICFIIPKKKNSET